MVYFYYLDMSYSETSIDRADRSLPSSNVFPSSDTSSKGSNASSSNPQISLIRPNARESNISPPGRVSLAPSDASSSALSYADDPEPQGPQQPSKVFNSTVPIALLSAQSPSSQPSILVTLREKVKKLPLTVPVANKTHTLAAYSQSPQKLTSDIQNDEDVWETWDQKLNVFLQCNDDELKQLVVRGKFGLIGLVGFFEHLVRDRKVAEGLIEGKAKRLLDTIDAYVSFFIGSLNDILIPIGIRL